MTLDCVAGFGDPLGGFELILNWVLRLVMALSERSGELASNFLGLAI